MTEAEKDIVRAKVKADDERFAVGLAPFYLGKWCPFFGGECKGPECMVFMPYRNGDKLVAACGVTLAASQIGPIADAMIQAAAPRGSDPGLSKIIPGSNGTVIR